MWEGLAERRARSLCMRFRCDGSDRNVHRLRLTCDGLASICGGCESMSDGCGSTRHRFCWTFEGLNRTVEDSTERAMDSVGLAMDSNPGAMDSMESRWPAVEVPTDPSHCHRRVGQPQLVAKRHPVRSLRPRRATNDFQDLR